jgi:hypothetical protein
MPPIMTLDTPVAPADHPRCPVKLFALASLAVPQP